MFEYIGIILPAITLLTAIWRGSSSFSFDVFFRYILCYIMVNETLGIIVQLYTPYSNFFLYNIYSFIIFILFIQLFYRHTNSVKWKKRMNVFSVLLVLIFIAENLYLRNLFTEMQFYTYIPGAIFLILTVSGYLYEIIDSDRIIYFYKLRSFWVGMGLLLFYVPFIPILVSYNYELFDLNVQTTLILSLNIIMHVCFIISYLWAEKI